MRVFNLSREVLALCSIENCRIEYGDYISKEYPKEIDMIRESLETHTMPYEAFISLDGVVRCRCRTALDAKYGYCPYCGQKLAFNKEEVKEITKDWVTIAKEDN